MTASGVKAQWGLLGYEGSFLGFPSSDEYGIGSGRRQDFAGGQVTWDSTTGTTDWSAGPTSSAGVPPWATNVSYQLSDTVTATVNVGTGNMNLTVAGLTVPGVGGDHGIGVVYNSLAAGLGSTDPTTATLGVGFRLSDSVGTPIVGMGANGAVRYTDASGRSLIYSLNTSTGVYTPQTGNLNTTLTKNSGGDWVLTTLASNRKQTFRAADGLITSDADRNGNATTYAYNSSGQPTTITGTRAGGTPVTFTIGGTGVPAGHIGAMTQTIDGVTRTVTLGYDASANTLTSVTDATGKKTFLTWNGGDLGIVQPANGKTTAFGYDTSHRVTVAVRDWTDGGINATNYFTYGQNNQGMATTAVKDPAGGTTTYVLDAFGKVLSAADPLGHLKAATYSPNNDVLTAVDAMPGANTTRYTYNGVAGGFTPTGATAPTGAASTAAYPSSGNGPLRYLPTSGTDPQGNTTTAAYDAAGNPTQQVTGGVTTSTTYNPTAGQTMVCAGGGKPGQPCTSTDGRGNTTTYTYSSTGNLLKVTPPSSGVIKATSYTYDGAGRPASVTDGKGQVTTYTYDKNDRVLQVRYGGATSCGTAANCEVYGYDAVGNLTSRVDGAGTTSYTYDALNRLATQTSPAASGGGAQTTSLAYDLNGNLAGFTDPTGSTRYGYDAGNNLILLAEPGGDCVGSEAVNPFETLRS